PCPSPRTQATRQRRPASPPGLDAHHPLEASQVSGRGGTITLMTTLSAPRALADGVSRRTLTIGPHTIDTPVVLAPMAGITNMAFRLLCREVGALHSHDDGGLYVSEMVTTRALVEDHRESWRLVTMGESESPRSVQLYGVDPVTVRRAVEMLIERDQADHIDLNFGC